MEVVQASLRRGRHRPWAVRAGSSPGPGRANGAAEEAAFRGAAGSFLPDERRASPAAGPSRSAASCVRAFCGVRPD